MQVGDGGPGAELPDQPCLAVEGGVMLRVDLIFIGEDDLAVLYQHRAEGLVAMLCGQLGKADGLAHEGLILRRGIVRQSGFHIRRGDEGAMLQVVDGPQRALMGFLGRTGHGIFNHMDMIVVLMGVHRRIVDADIRQPADQIEGVHAKALQQDFKIGGEERAVTALGDQIFALDGVGQLGVVVFRAVFHAVDALGAVQLPAEVHHVRAAALLDLNDGQLLCPEYIQDPLAVANDGPSGVIHVVFVHFHEIFLLDVDDQQGAVFLQFHYKTSVI